MHYWRSVDVRPHKKVLYRCFFAYIYIFVKNVIIYIWCIYIYIWCIYIYGAYIYIWCIYIYIHDPYIGEEHDHYPLAGRRHDLTRTSRREAIPKIAILLGESWYIYPLSDYIPTCIYMSYGIIRYIMALFSYIILYDIVLCNTKLYHMILEFELLQYT
jgi:hypothetical protein